MWCGTYYKRKIKLTYPDTQNLSTVSMEQVVLAIFSVPGKGTIFDLCI